MPQPTPSARAKYIAQLTGHPPQARGTGARSQLSASWAERPAMAGGRQDNTAPQRVLGARAKAFAAIQQPAPPPRPQPVLVVALPGGQLGVLTSQLRPLDATGLFTRHLVWSPPTTAPHAPAAGPQAILRQGRPWPAAESAVDWAHLWQRLLAALPRPRDGYIFYGSDGHATGMVPTHARAGNIVGTYDIT